MNWDAIGAVAEAVGAAGVIITLAYLALQLRENTRALRATSYQEATQAGRTFLDTLARDGTAGTYAIGLREYPNLSAAERRVFVHAFNTFANSVQEAFPLHEAGTLDTGMYRALLAGLAGHAQTPGGAVVWKEIRPHFPGTFVEALEDVIASGEVPDFLESPYFPVDELDYAARGDRGGGDA